MRWLPEELLENFVPHADRAGSLTFDGMLPEAWERISAGELIVIADDNADMRDYLRRLLRERYRVHAVSNGEDAVRAARELNADLVLADVMMPGLDGFGVLHALRSNPETQAKPVILLSARAGEESRVEGLQAGADDYLVKPFASRELLARVSAHLKMARVRAEAAEVERSLRAEAELEEAEQRLRALNNKLLRAQDEERRRLARELHDSAGQMLVALSMNLVPLEQYLAKQNPELNKLAASRMELVDELSRELRTRSHLLHPPLLDEAGLKSALRWYVEGFAERSGIQVGLQLDSNLPRLPQEVETTIFRIVQESLTNIHRHSGSKNGSLRIDHDSQNTRVEIRDEGKGISQLNSAKNMPMRAGVGIQGMQERVRQLQGKFEIKSGQNGTTVIVVLPNRAISATAKNRKA